MNINTLTFPILGFRILHHLGRNQRDVVGNSDEERYPRLVRQWEGLNVTKLNGNTVTFPLIRRKCSPGMLETFDADGARVCSQ